MIELEKPDRTDPKTWSPNEQIRLLLWHIQTHSPEAIEQFQAIRDIERAIEEEKQTAETKHYYGWTDPTIYSPYANRSYSSTMTVQEDSKKESLWDAMKRMAGY